MLRGVPLAGIVRASLSLAAAAFAVPVSAEAVYTLDQDAAVMRLIDSATGATLATRSFTFANGAVFQAGLAIAYRRVDSTLFLVADTSAGVVLARVATVACLPSGCVTTVAGILPASPSSRITGLSFDCSTPPVLYGVTGSSASIASNDTPSGGPTAHALFIVNQTTAALGSALLSFADGADGLEEIATIATPGTLYRYGGDLIQSFSRVDLGVPSAMSIPTSNGAVPGIGGMTYLAFEDKLLASTGAALRTISFTGDIQPAATLDHVPAGLASTANSCFPLVFANGFE